MVPIDTTRRRSQAQRSVEALGAADPSVRLRTVLAAGAQPDPDLLESLVERCAVEPDFFVRDMLTWALTRLPPAITLPRLRRELDSERPQARSQALHTLSKVGDSSAWPWITRELLRDPDDEVARTAWRVAVGLVPEEEKPLLADELVRQLGRGGPDVQLSLSRSLVELGNVIESGVGRAAGSADPAVAAHARATLILLRDPAAGFKSAITEAKRILTLGPDGAAIVAAVASGGSDIPNAPPEHPVLDGDASVGDPQLPGGRGRRVVRPPSTASPSAASASSSTQ